MITLYNEHLWTLINTSLFLDAEENSMRVAGRHATLMTSEFVVITSVFPWLSIVNLRTRHEFSHLAVLSMVFYFRLCQRHWTTNGVQWIIISVEIIHLKFLNCFVYFCNFLVDADSWFGIHEKIAKVQGWRLIQPADFFLSKKISISSFKVSLKVFALLYWSDARKARNRWQLQPSGLAWHSALFDWQQLIGNSEAGWNFLIWLHPRDISPPDLMLNWCFLESPKKQCRK